MLSESGRVHQIDKRFDSDVQDTDFSNQLFVRLVAKEKTFTKINFHHAIFDTCHLRKCRFDSCEFVGCRFVATHLHGSTFSGCKFDYAVFERTLVDARILDTECPGSENLKRAFARSLRTNFQQMGDAQSVNKAIGVELETSKLKAWNSNESYYRKKYTGLDRVRAFFEWLSFTILDFLWGNGESV